MILAARFSADLKQLYDTISFTRKERGPHIGGATPPQPPPGEIVPMGSCVNNNDRHALSIGLHDGWPSQNKNCEPSKKTARKLTIMSI